VLNHVVRYEPVVALIEPLPAVSLLEVGSGSRGISRYLHAPLDVTACDLSFDDYGSDNPGDGGGVARVTASVLALPFADGEFDVVLALDLVEHLAPGDREPAIRELVRVGRVAVIVGCPTGAAALRADQRLAAYIRRLRRPLPGWLEEHLENGFPTPDELVRWMDPADTVIANERIRAHAVICALEATPLLARAPLALASLLSPRLRSPRVRRLVRALRGRDRGPTYRTIVVRLGGAGT
jgi:hypothetical protein